jgi:hypothetical protein
MATLTPLGAVDYLPHRQFSQGEGGGNEGTFDDTLAEAHAALAYAVLFVD